MAKETEQDDSPELRGRVGHLKLLKLLEPGDILVLDASPFLYCSVSATVLTVCAGVSHTCSQSAISVLTLEILFKRSLTTCVA